MICKIEAWIRLFMAVCAEAIGIGNGMLILFSENTSSENIRE